MGAKEWLGCDLLESVPGRVSGAVVFKDTRLPVEAVVGNVCEPLADDLPGHQVSTVRELGLKGIKNGDLLALVESLGADAFVTGDKSMETHAEAYVRDRGGHRQQGNRGAGCARPSQPKERDGAKQVH